MTSGFEFIIEKNKNPFFFKIKKKENNKNIKRKQKTGHHSSLITLVNIDAYSFFLYKLIKIQSIIIIKNYNESMLFWLQAKVMSDE